MKIALIGYGKMGHEIERIAIQRGHEIVATIDKDNQEVFDSPDFRKADVAIEFTAPSVAYDNVKRCMNACVKVVSGSTGWIESHREELMKLCKEQNKTFFWASNFSLGVTIFRAVNKYLAKIMNQFKDYDVSLTETHHVHKLDAPSGTAITLAQEAIANLDEVKGYCLMQNEMHPEGLTEVPESTLPITAIREGEVFGIHTVQYESNEDKIQITHDAKNRGGFALGAVLAAEYANKHQGFLTTEDLFPFLAN